MPKVRFLVVLLSGFFAGSRLVAAALSWKAWRHHAADLDAHVFHQAFLTDLAIALLSLAIAGLVTWLLRPVSGKTSSP